MQSTPVRVSILALGTVTTLAAYGLGKTNATTPDEKPKTPDPTNKKKTTKPFPFLAPKTAAIAKPEQSATPLKVVPVPGSLAALRTSTPKPIQTPPAIRRISVDQLPIDNIVASTLPSEKATPKSKPATKPAIAPSANPSTPASERKIAVAPQVAATPQVAIATPPPPPAIRPESSNTISATEVDDSSYALGPGDQIRVELFNVPEYSRDYQVLVNGTVNLYLVGPISVKGMTPLEAQAAIAAKYAPIVSKARVDVTLLATRPVRVAIAGEVAHPGTYAMSTPGNAAPTLTQLIQQAGGITQAANSRFIQIRRSQRGTPLTITADLWALTTQADNRQDLVLRDGDAVVVPTLDNINLAEAGAIAATNIATDPKKAINIAVVGEVMRPGSQILAQTGGALPTLSQAIQQAGGIAPLANVREVEVRRTTRKGTTQVTRLNLWELLASGDATQDMVLQQGDTIMIPKGTALTAAESSKIQGSTFAAASIRVSVVGEVERPGTLEVTPSTPLNQAILSAGGFNRRANKKSVHLLRLNPDGTVSRQPISIDLATGVDEKGNPMLRNNDVILVDRSGGAKVTDTLGDIGGIFGKILPFNFLFR
jgi:polysaccharide biosynthesis/export protein